MIGTKKEQSKVKFASKKFQNVRLELNEKRKGRIANRFVVAPVV